MHSPSARALSTITASSSCTHIKTLKASSVVFNYYTVSRCIYIIIMHNYYSIIYNYIHNIYWNYLIYSFADNKDYIIICFNKYCVISQLAHVHLPRYSSSLNKFLLFCYTKCLMMKRC